MEEPEGTHGTQLRSVSSSEPWGWFWELPVSMQLRSAAGWDPERQAEF